MEEFYFGKPFDEKINAQISSIQFNFFQENEKLTLWHMAEISFKY
jgi:hypothetical protein